MAAIAYLRQVDGWILTVSLCGHSLGASWLRGSRERADNRRVSAGLIMMAPNARALTDLMLEQYDYLAKLGGRSREAAQIDSRAP